MQLGIPGFGSGIHVQQMVEGAHIISSIDSVPSGTNLTVALEMWSHNYGPQNDATVSGASDTVYDWGDQIVSETPNGYGCLQIHVPARKTTVLAINRFAQPGNADLGIGNSTGKNSDWTFAGNAQSFTHKRLRVFVRPRPQR